MMRGVDDQSQLERRCRQRRKAVVGLLGVAQGYGRRKMWDAMISNTGSGTWLVRLWDAIHCLRRRIVADRDGKCVTKFRMAVVWIGAGLAMFFVVCDALVPAYMPVAGWKP